MAEQGPAGDGASTRANRFILAAGAILALVVVIGVAVVYFFVENQRERDLQAWQTRLGIVANSRAAAVNEWVREQFFTMSSLAENASLQLYMTKGVGGVGRDILIMLSNPTTKPMIETP